MEKTFMVYRPMTNEPETEITVKVEHDTFHDTTEPVWRVSYWSDARGRDVTEDFDEEPGADEIAALLVKSERADDVWPA